MPKFYSLFKSKKSKFFVAAFILWLLFSHFYAPRFITELRNPLVELLKPEHLILGHEKFNASDLNGEEVSYAGYHGDKQTGFLRYSDLDIVKGTIVLVHGIRGNKEHFLPMANRLAANGYNSVAIDLRAHGESEGQYCTFGVHEKFDVIGLLDYLEKEKGLNSNFGIWGQSLGGAVSIQVLAIDSRFKFGIIESTFTDYETIANDYFQYFANFNCSPMMDYLVYRSGQIAEFDPYDARPLEKCKQITQPVLMVHGDKDRRISIDYGKANFENLRSEKKKFLSIDGGTHLNLWQIGGDEYFQEVISFIDSVDE